MDGWMYVRMLVLTLQISKVLCHLPASFTLFFVFIIFCFALFFLFFVSFCLVLLFLLLRTSFDTVNHGRLPHTFEVATYVRAASRQTFSAELRIICDNEKQSFDLCFLLADVKRIVLHCIVVMHDQVLYIFSRSLASCCSQAGKKAWKQGIELSASRSICFVNMHQRIETAHGKYSLLFSLFFSLLFISVKCSFRVGF